MKRCLLMLALVAAVGLSCLTPEVSLAAGKAVASQIVETVPLNQATAEELQDLPGIGPALAERIVAYRKEHGPFKSIEQLAEVKGIGQRKLETFRDRLTLK